MIQYFYRLGTSFHSHTGHSDTFDILQVFSENMGKKSEPEITTSLLGANWTMITFRPDLTKFHMTHLDDDIMALMRKRVVDMVGFLGMTVQVMFNGQTVQRLESFPDSVYPYLRTASIGRYGLPRFGDNFSNKHQFECCYVCKLKLIQIVSLII